MTCPASEITNAPSSCASSLIVPRTSGSVICVRAGAWPASGSRMSGRDAASTASTLPTVNNVPIRRPSRPSRAISSASSRADSRTAGSHQEIREHNVFSEPSGWSSKDARHNKASLTDSRGHGTCYGIATAAALGGLGAEPVEDLVSGSNIGLITYRRLRVRAALPAAGHRLTGLPPVVSGPPTAFRFGCGEA
jgi:hypothetical protein